MDPFTAIGNILGFDFGKSDAPSYPDPVDYSEAIAYQSDNNKTVALGQIQAQELALQQASLDREMQSAAHLELGLENLDTKLQIDRFDFTQEMTAEEDRHVEKLAAARNKLHGLQTTYTLGADLPPPTSNEKEHL